MEHYRVPQVNTESNGFINTESRVNTESNGKYREKLNKYQQLIFTTREKRPGYNVEILPMIIGCLGCWNEKVGGTSCKDNEG